MTIQDGNAERRNLTVLAFMIVVYYLGGGQPIGNEIKLSMISVEFTNPTALKSALWVVLAWFTYRHWVANRNEHLANMKASKCALTVRRSAFWLLPPSPTKNKLKELNTSYVTGTYEDPVGKRLLQVDYFVDHRSRNAHVTLTDTSDKLRLQLFNLLVHIILLVKQRYLLDFWAPILLAIFAVLLAITN